MSASLPWNQPLLVGNGRCTRCQHQFPRTDLNKYSGGILICDTCEPDFAMAECFKCKQTLPLRALVSFDGCGLTRICRPCKATKYEEVE